MIRLRPSPPVIPARKTCLLPSWLMAMAMVSLSFPPIAFTLDSWLYHQAEQAYKEANCERAIAGYTTLLKRWRPHDWRNYEVRSKARIKACKAYQAGLPGGEGRSQFQPRSR